MIMIITVIILIILMIRLMSQINPPVDVVDCERFREEDERENNTDRFPGLRWNTCNLCKSLVIFANLT